MSPRSADPARSRLWALVYEAKRRNLIEKSQNHFGFLVSDFEFESPKYTFFKQANGTIILEKFEYLRIDKIVVFQMRIILMITGLKSTSLTAKVESVK